MSLAPPSKSTLQDTIVAIWQSIRPDADATIYSDLWLYSKVTATLVFRLHQTIQRALNNVFPTSSSGVYLDNWLRWIGASDGSGGFGRILARGSSGTDALRVPYAGAPGATLNQTLTDTAGKVYKATENLTGAGSPEDISVEAVDTGADTNLETGAVLTWTSPPANVDDTATLVLDLDGGADEETDAEGRARLLLLLQKPPASGNVADWVKAIEDASPGNLKAYVWPKRENQPYGYGRTDYMAFQTNERGTAKAIAAATALYTAIGDAVDADLPVLLARNSRQLTTSAVTCNVEITITLSDDAGDAQKCDWDAQGNKTTVASHVAGGNNITASANVCSPTITNGITVGDRVVIDGIEGIATAVNVGADAKVFTVGTWPWGAGAGILNGKDITSGGGLIGQKTDATLETTGSGVVGTIQDYMDALGPAKGTYAAGAQISGWEDTCRVQGIQSDVIQFGDGYIIDVTVNDIAGGGAVDKTPTAGSGATTEFLYVTEITVWQVFV